MDGEGDGERQWKSSFHKEIFKKCLCSARQIQRLKESAREEGFLLNLEESPDPDN